MLSSPIVIRPIQLLTVLFCSLTLVGQQTQAAPSSAGARDFPVVMSQKVVAGGTPVGNRVEAKLEVATLMNGIVLPRGAVFAGEVIESAAKSGSDPSRLQIRMDSVTWKKGSAPVKVYLTAWYYPMRDAAGPNLSYGPPDANASPRNWNGQGTYPDPNSPASRPFPEGRHSNDGASSLPSSPSSSISNHRVLIRDVEPARTSDGGVAIVSSHSNIKLDKVTTYVLAAGESAMKN